MVKGPLSVDSLLKIKKLNQPAHILLIEDTQDQANLLLSHLAAAGHSLTPLLHAGEPQLSTALEGANWDAVLLSDSLAGMDAAHALDLIQNIRPGLPVIVLCADYQEQLAAALISAGANDVLPRGQFARLLPVLQREMLSVRRMDEYSRADVQLRENESRYRDLFEYSPISLWEEDFSAVKLRLNDLAAAGISDFRAYFQSRPAEVAELAGMVRVLDVNRATLDFYQASSKALLLKSLAQIFEQGNALGFQEELFYIAEGRSFFEWEGVNYSLNGDRLYVSVRWAAMTGHEQDLSRVIVSVIDITSRKRHEQDLRQAEAMLRGLVEQVPAVVYTEDFKQPSELFYISPQVEVLTGFSAADWLGQPGFWRSHIHPEDFSHFDQADQDSNRTGEPFNAEYRLLKRDGQAVWVHDECVLIRGEDGQPQFWQGLMINISDRKQAEQSLLDSQMRFHSYFELPLTGIAISSPEKGWLDVNERLCEILGYSKHELTSMTWSELTHPDDLQQDDEQFHRVLAGEIDGFSMEKRFIRWDGRALWTSMATRAVRKPDDSVDYFVTIIEDISERKQAEQDLRASQMRFHSYFDLPLIGIAITSPEKGWIDVNERLCLTLGYSKQELVAMTWAELTHPDDILRDAQQFQRVLAGEIESYSLDKRFITRDGHILWTSMAARCVRKPDGSVDYFVAIIEDINARVQAEQAVRASEEKYRLLTETLSDVVWTMDVETLRFLYVSPSVFRLRGFTPDEIIAEPMDAALTPEGSRMVRASIARQVDGFTSGTLPAGSFFVNEVEQPCKDGTTVWTEVVTSYFLNPTTGRVEVHGVTRDIRLRKKAEAETNRRLGELQALYENSLTLNRLIEPQQIALALISTLEARLNWHHASVRLFNPLTKKVELLAITQFGPAQQRANTARMSQEITLNRQGLSAWVFEHGQVVRCPQVLSDSRYFETHPGIQSGLYVPLRSGERTIGTISVESEQPDAFSEQDERLLVTIAAQAAISIENAQLYSQAQAELTARIQAEADLLQAHARLEERVVERTTELRAANLELEKAARMKDEFLASMSHELRTPLTGILGLSEVMLLESYGPLNPKQTTSLTHIQSSGRHLLELINDILDLSKIEAGKFELYLAPCSLGEICQACLQMTSAQAAAKALQVGYAISPASIILKADGRRLKQIIINLLSNAIKFTPQGGSLGIEVKTSLASNPEPDSQLNPQVHICVWDTGIGIQAEDQTRLFRPFIQLDARLSRQYPGTGLGLALVRRLAELHAGSVSVESVPGQGSRFTVSLPWLG